MVAKASSSSISVVDEQLFLGSAAECDAGSLRALGVTHVVSVTVDEPAPDGFECLHVPVADDLGAPLHFHLEAAAAFIHAATAPPAVGRACILCGTGRSAAPAVLCYYLMRHRELSLADALGHVEAARPGARPNVGFWQRLVEAEAWLRGEGQPSVSVQQYRWQHLERAFPEAAASCDARGELLQQLASGHAEARELVRVRSEWVAK